MNFGSFNFDNDEGNLDHNVGMSSCWEDQPGFGGLDDGLDMLSEADHGASDIDGAIQFRNRATNLYTDQ